MVLLCPPFSRSVSTAPSGKADYDYLLGIRALNFVPTGVGGRFIHNNFMAIANLFAAIYPMVTRALPQPPSNPALGQTYFDTTTQHFFGWNGAEWRRLD